MVELEEIEKYKNAVGGVIKDKEDNRDFIFSSQIVDLPTSVDLRKFSGEIENQLSTGSCVANATCSSLEIMSKEINEEVDLSRLFVYYFAREPYPELKEVDRGSYIRDGFKVCNKYGVPSEKDWAFVESKVNVRPSERSIQNAKHNRVIEYKRIPDKDINGVKASLSLGNPVIFGMYVFEDFFKLVGPMENYNYTGSKSGSAYAGGHAMNIVGYDDNLNGGSFIVENSWSDQWGDQGYWAMKYQVFLDDAMDIWTCTDFKTGITDTPDDEFEINICDSSVEYKDVIHKELKDLVDISIEFPREENLIDAKIDYIKELVKCFS